MLSLIRVVFVVCCLQILIVPVVSYAGVITIRSKQELINYGVFQSGEDGKLICESNPRYYYNHSEKTFVIFQEEDQYIVSRNNTELFQEVRDALSADIQDLHTPQASLPFFQQPPFPLVQRPLNFLCAPPSTSSAAPPSTSSAAPPSTSSAAPPSISSAASASFGTAGSASHCSGIQSPSEYTSCTARRIRYSLST